MKCLSFLTETDAKARNHAEAIARDAGGAFDVTQYWWDMIEHEGAWLLLVGDDPVLESETVVEIAIE